MLLTVRPAVPEDGTLMTRLLDAAYGGGYSPTFDRDGPLQPQDLWWVRAEKDLSILEVDRRAAGLLVVGRRGSLWLVEDVLLAGYGAHPARTQQALVERLGAHLVATFRRGRQTTLLLRAAEGNPFGLALAHHLRATFANALLVYRYRGARRPAVQVPDGYQVRRAVSADARAVGRLTREILGEGVRPDEIERALSARDGRAYLAVRDEVPVGFALAEVRPGRGDWTVGVREPHRGRGLGRALAQSVIGTLHGRGAAPYATVWALDPVAGPFLRALGFALERTFLYVERAL